MRLAPFVIFVVIAMFWLAQVAISDTGSVTVIAPRVFNGATTQGGSIRPRAASSLGIYGAGGIVTRVENGAVVIDGSSVTGIPGPSPDLNSIIVKTVPWGFDPYGYWTKDDQGGYVLNLGITLGPQGPIGRGLIPGGSMGQVLQKLSNADWDTIWVDSIPWEIHALTGQHVTVWVDSDGILDFRY